MEANSFDPKKVSFIVDGKYITGYMDGTFIAAEKNEDNVVPHIGAHGDVTFTESADETGTITVTLKNTSSSLPFLEALSKRTTVFPAQVIDANDGKYKAGGTQCRILKKPAREFANEVTGVEVQIYVADFGK